MGETLLFSVSNAKRHCPVISFVLLKIGSPWYFKGKHKILPYIILSAIVYNTALRQEGVGGKRVYILHLAVLPCLILQATLISIS